MTLRPSTKGWIGLAIYVTLWDLLAPETLSAGFDDALHHPRRRWQVIAVWVYVTGHLFVLIPRRVDPLRNLRRLHVPSR